MAGGDELVGETNLKALRRRHLAEAVALRLFTTQPGHLRLRLDCFRAVAGRPDAQSLHKYG